MSTYKITIKVRYDDETDHGDTEGMLFGELEQAISRGLLTGPTAELVVDDYRLYVSCIEAPDGEAAKAEFEEVMGELAELSGEPEAKLGFPWNLQAGDEIRYIDRDGLLHGPFRLAEVGYRGTKGDDDCVIVVTLEDGTKQELSWDEIE